MQSDAALAFIGGGNMARCLLGGALAAGVPAARIRIGEPSASVRRSLKARFGVQTTSNNARAVDGAGTVVLAVKPQHAADAVRAVSSRIDGHALVISVMAGIRSDDLRRWLGAGPGIIRCMPNTPALIGRGATALFATPGTSARARREADRLLRSVGSTVWVDDEPSLDMVTAVSGSGPAYCFLFIEALEAAAVAAGLDRAAAATLVRETVRGAAEMAVAGDPAELRRQVTSPGGTTEAALACLQAGGFGPLLADAVRAAADRARALAEQYGREP